MIRYFAYITLLSIVWSCSDSKDNVDASPENFTQSQIDSILTQFQFDYEDPIFLNNSNYIAFPVSTGIIDKRKGYSNESYGNYEFARYWNFIFYNDSTRSTKLLTNKKFKISHFDCNMEKVGEILSHSILYQMGNVDYNSDHKLNDSDPEQLYISNNDGSNLRRLSPLNEDLYSYSIIPNSDKIFIRTKRDDNDDLKFNYKDASVLYIIDLKVDSIARLVLDSVSQKTIENLYFKEWIREKL